MKNEGRSSKESNVVGIVVDSNPFEISQDSVLVNSISGNQLEGGAGKQLGAGGLYPLGMA